MPPSVIFSRRFDADAKMIITTAMARRGASFTPSVSSIHLLLYGPLPLSRLSRCQSAGFAVVRLLLRDTIIPAYYYARHGCCYSISVDDAVLSGR